MMESLTSSELLFTAAEEAGRSLAKLTMVVLKGIVVLRLMRLLESSVGVDWLS